MALSVPRKAARLLTISMASPTPSTWRWLGSNLLRSILSRRQECVQRSELGSIRSPNDKEEAKVEWVNLAGRIVARCALEEGKSLLDAARSKGIELEGACDGNLACSTCHVVLEEGVFGLLERPSEQEEDLLDLAYGLERCSRLGCQVKLDQLKAVTSKITVRLPSAVGASAADDGLLTAGGDGGGG